MSPSAVPLLYGTVKKDVLYASNRSIASRKMAVALRYTSRYSGAVGVGYHAVYK